MPNIPRLIAWNKFPLGPKLPICLICREPVALESGKIDENGRPIHEECYLLKIELKAATTPKAVESSIANLPTAHESFVI